MKPLVSIIIPAYNAGEWIDQSIRSAVDQTWINKEVIVVDDGSTDNTLCVAKRHESSLVKVVTQQNQGAAAARNHAYSLCNGDYIQWFDADDLLKPDKIEKQMLWAESDKDPTVLYSGAWAFFYYRTEVAKFIPSALWADFAPVDWMICKMTNNLHMQPNSWLVSRQVTEAAGLWDTALWRDNDGEYFCRVILNSSRIRFIEDAKSFYRLVGTSSISHVGSSQRKIESLFRSINLHVNYLRQMEDSPRTREACLKYIATWLIYFYPERMDLFAQLQLLGRDLGGDIEEPQLRGKYRLFGAFFGWPAGKRAQRITPLLKECVLRHWDHAMYNQSKEAQLNS